jgi:hypothetical protein
VRDAYRRLVAQGWTDALRALHPGLRIDHLLLSPSLAGRLVAAGVERVTMRMITRSDSRLCASGFGCGTGRRRSAGRTLRPQRYGGNARAGRPHNPC